MPDQIANGAYEDGTARRVPIVFLAGPIKHWWTCWGSPAHTAYVAHRDAVRRELIDAGYLTYASWDAFKGTWDARAQALNDAAIGIADVLVDLTPDGIPADGTADEVAYAARVDTPSLRVPPGTHPGRLRYEILALAGAGVSYYEKGYAHADAYAAAIAADIEAQAAEEGRADLRDELASLTDDRGEPRGMADEGRIGEIERQLGPDLSNEGGMLGGTDDGQMHQTSLDQLRDEYEDLMHQGRTTAAREVLERRDVLLQSVPTVRIGRVMYRVERRDSTQTPYYLHGPRGACYGLMRNVNTHSRLFMFNIRGFTRGTPDVWFRDDGGELRPC